MRYWVSCSPWPVAGCPPRAVVLLSEEREAAASRVARLTKTRRRQNTNIVKPIPRKRLRSDAAMKKAREPACGSSYVKSRVSRRYDKKRKKIEIHKELKDLTESSTCSDRK